MLNGIFNNQYPYTDFHELNLSWTIHQIQAILTAIKQIDGWIDTHEEQYEQLKALYDAVMSGNFPPTITQAFSNWMRVNGLDIVGELAKMVIFNITDEGYFVAYIPEGWDDIIFSTTGLDEFIPGVDYGRLVLSYDV